MKPITPTQKGLITGALMVLAAVFSLFVLKNPVESYFQFVVYGIFCLGIIWSLLAHSKSAAENKTFKDFFSVGFKTFIVITLLMAGFTFIYFTFHPEFNDAKIEENSRMLLRQGDHLPREIEENANQLRKMFMPMMISSAVFLYLILGVIITVIAAGFLSQKNQTAV